MFVQLSSSNKTGVAFSLSFYRRSFLFFLNFSVVHELLNPFLSRLFSNTRRKGAKELFLLSLCSFRLSAGDRRNLYSFLDGKITRFTTKFFPPFRSPVHAMPAIWSLHARMHAACLEWRSACTVGIFLSFFQSIEQYEEGV